MLIEPSPENPASNTGITDPNMTSSYQTDLKVDQEGQERKKTYNVSCQFLQATLKDVLLPMGLRIEEVEFHARGVNVDIKKKTALFEDPCDVSATISADALKEFILLKAPVKLSSLFVSIADGLVHIQAKVKLLISMEANIECRLEVVDKSKVFARIHSVKVAGVGAQNLIQSLVNSINPVFDLEEFPVDGGIEMITLENNLVKVFVVGIPSDSLFHSKK